MNNGLVDGNKQNAPSAPEVRTHSNFDLSRHVFGTYRFGELAPCFCMDAVPKDKIPVNSRHNVRSYTLKAPLMQDVEMRKDSFAVPREAILPFNWDKVYTNPVIGDDVTVDVGTCVEDFSNKIALYFKNALAAFSQLTDAVEILTKSLQWLILGESVFSHGSLASSLGYRFASLGRVTMEETSSGVSSHRSFDFYFDAVISNLRNVFTKFDFTYDNHRYTVFTNTVGSSSYPVCDLREFIELLREDVTAVTINAVTKVSGVGTPDVLMLTPASTNDYISTAFDYVSASVKYPVDIARLWAYQLIVAHYYSNDHVDFVYSAELYRQNVYSLIDSESLAADFLYNGVSTPYDYLSAYYFNQFISSSLNFFDNEHIAYLQLIFSFRHSLRYVDYFVGSRVSPLAIGNVNANVVGGAVSAIDTTRSIQMQRFLNAVNRAGRKFSNYVKEMFGVTPAQDFHNPIYLGHTTDKVYTVETENTGAAQWSQANSITSDLRSNSERFLLEYYCDRPAIVITIMSFDVVRVYDKAMERQIFHKDRFDMFNPFLQYLGDQRVYEAELLPILAGGTELARTFGYQNRHQEYKESFNTCFGGFVENLPGWCFIADKFGSASYVKNIDPDFIRSKSCEFDKFYLSLTGYSLGSYFHFIIDNFNMVNASRPMSYNPNIL